MPADHSEPGCPWRIRDRAGWRAGLLLTASADVLVAWYAARHQLHRRTWTAAVGRYGDLVDHLAQARRAGDLAAVERACRRLVARAAAPPRPARSLHPVFADLRHRLATDGSCLADGGGFPWCRPAADGASRWCGIAR